MKFDLYICLFSGIAATATMTLFLNVFSALQRRRFMVILVLGTMLTGETTNYKGLSRSRKSFTTGIIVHYLLGCLFSYFYYMFCSLLGGFTILNALFFSLAAGFVAITGWRFLFFVHSRPPLIDIADYLRMIFAAHILFTFILYTVYNVLY